MARGGRTPRCPTVSDECVETAATPAAHEYVSFALLFACQVLVERAGSVSATPTLWGSRFEEPVPYRVAGGAASGGSLRRMGVGARPRLSPFPLYTHCRGFTHVTPHGRLASTVCNCRVNFSAATRPSASESRGSACRKKSLRIPRIYHRQARPLRSSNRKPCSSWSSSARSPPRHLWRMHRW